MVQAIYIITFSVSVFFTLAMYVRLLLLPGQDRPRCGQLRTKPAVIRPLDRRSRPLEQNIPIDLCHKIDLGSWPWIYFRSLEKIDFEKQILKKIPQLGWSQTLLLTYVHDSKA